MSTKSSEEDSLELELNSMALGVFMLATASACEAPSHSSTSEKRPFSSSYRSSCQRSFQSSAS